MKKKEKEFKLKPIRLSCDLADKPAQQVEKLKAEAAAKISQLTLNRYKKLLGTQYISQQDYDTALADAQQANAAVVAAKAAVETARINLA